MPWSPGSASTSAALNLRMVLVVVVLVMVLVLLLLVVVVLEVGRTAVSASTVTSALSAALSHTDLRVRVSTQHDDTRSLIDTPAVD